LILAAYSNSLNGPFIYDDVPSIVKNPGIRSLTTFLKMPRNVAVSGRPIVSLTLAVNYMFDGLEVAGYHLLNLLIHVSNAFLVFLLLWKLLTAGPVPIDRSKGPWLSFAIAAIWAVHPLGSDAVTYVIQRTELLMSLFLLLTLFCMLKASSSGKVVWCVAAVVFCGLGMASKEVMVVAPLLAILFDWIFLARRPSDRMPRRRWLHAGLTSTWLILALLLASGPRSATVGFEFVRLGPLDYLLTQCGVVVHYLRLAFWPHPLSIDYNSWPVASGLAEVIVPATLLFALFTSSLWAIVKKPVAGFAGLWFFLILAPSSSFVPIASELAAERRMYLPLVAVIGIVVWGVQLIISAGKGSKNAGIAAGIMLGIAIVSGIAATRDRNEAYRSEIAIWSDVLDHFPRNALAHNNLGSALGRAGKIQEAIQHFLKAIELNPRYAEAFNNLGAAQYSLGRAAEAEKQIREALRLKPDYTEARYNLGLSLHNLGRLEEAVAEYSAVLHASPEDAEANNHMGAALLSLGRRGEAVNRFETALRLKPGYREAAENLEKAKLNQPSGASNP
jgi:protein O-mannosyl-transferase